MSAIPSQNLHTAICRFSAWTPSSSASMPSRRYFFFPNRLGAPFLAKHFVNGRSVARIPYCINRICPSCRAAMELNAVDSSPPNGFSPPILSDDPSVAGLVNVNGHAVDTTATMLADRSSVTGGAFDFRGATMPLISGPLPVAKKIVIVRHGLSSWNEESRIQGSSDLSYLSEKGAAQVLKCRNALANLKFDKCFASPIQRAKSSAELIWEGREEPLVFLDTLREANLLFLEGMRNADAKQQFPEVYKAWREDPENFKVNGVYPVVELWGKARKAWEEILSTQGELLLVVTHKSILRALICTALGMGPDRFRAMDINNGGIVTFTVNTSGEAMLQNLNMTAHLHTDGVYYHV